MKIIILALIIIIGILLYFLISNLYELYQKKHPQEQPLNDMDFNNSYKKYDNSKSSTPHPRKLNTIPECFSILGFTEMPSQEDLKKRHRELVKQYHPDRGGDAEKFEEISKAYNEALRILQQ